MALAGLVSALVLSGLYVVVTEGLSIIYVYLMAPFVLAGALGWPIGWVAKRTKVRHEYVPLIAGMLTGALTLYLIWVYCLAWRFDLEELVFSPGRMLPMMGQLASEELAMHKIGWESAGWSYGGWVHYPMWVLEAAIVIGGAGLMATIRGPGDVPFCTHCQRWCNVETLKRFTHLDPKQWKDFTQRLERGDCGVFEPIRRIEWARKTQWTEFDIITCPTCDRMNLICVRTVDSEAPRPGGGTGEQTDEVIHNLFVPPEVHAAIRAIPKAAGG